MHVCIWAYITSVLYNNSSGHLTLMNLEGITLSGTSRHGKTLHTISLSCVVYGSWAWRSSTIVVIHAGGWRGRENKRTWSRVRSLSTTGRKSKSTQLTKSVHLRSLLFIPHTQRRSHLRWWMYYFSWLHQTFHTSKYPTVYLKYMTNKFIKPKLQTDPK